MPGWKCWTGGCNRGCSDEPARLSVGARGLLPPAVVALVLVGLWQALHGVAGPDLVSSPGETLAALGRLMGTARFWLDVRETGLAFVWAAAAFGGAGNRAWGGVRAEPGFGGCGGAVAGDVLFVAQGDAVSGGAAGVRVGSVGQGGVRRDARAGADHLADAERHPAVEAGVLADVRR